MSNTNKVLLEIGRALINHANNAHEAGHTKGVFNDGSQWQVRVDRNANGSYDVSLHPDFLYRDKDGKKHSSFSTNRLEHLAVMLIEFGGQVRAYQDSPKGKSRPLGGAKLEGLTPMGDKNNTSGE